MLHHMSLTNIWFSMVELSSAPNYTSTSISSAAVSRTDGIIVLLLCSNGSTILGWPCLNYQYVFLDGECCRLSNEGVVGSRFTCHAVICWDVDMIVINWCRWTRYPVYGDIKTKVREQTPKGLRIRHVFDNINACLCKLRLLLLSIKASSSSSGVLHKSQMQVLVRADGSV